MLTVSLGALGDVKGGHEILKEVPGLLKKKNNQIEAYVSRRVSSKNEWFLSITVPPREVFDNCKVFPII